MQIQRVPQLLLTGALTPPAFAAQHIVDIHWDRAGAFAHARLVPAGKFLEVCVALKVWDTVRRRFAAIALVDNDVHYHVGKSAEDLTRLTQAAAGDKMPPVGATETYCWMWTNKSTGEVRVDPQLQR